MGTLSNLSAGDPMPAELTVADEVTGAVYTLNTTERAIRSSDGRVVWLDEELTVAAAAAIAATPAVDATDQDMQAMIGNPNDCDPADPSQPCDQVRGLERGPPRATHREPSRANQRNWPRRQTPGTLLRRAGRPWPPRPPREERANGRKGAYGRAVNDKIVAKSALRPVISALSIQGVTSCDGMAQRYFTSALVYQEKRSSFIRQLIEGVPSAIISGSTEEGARMLTAIGERTASALEMVIIAGLYYAQQCHTQRPRIGPLILGGPYVDGYSGWVMRCQDEDWEISFDSGQTWHPIVVNVCWFQRAE